MLWQAVISVILLMLVIRRWRLRKLIKLEKQIKSKIPQLPILGHAYHFFTNHEVRMQSFAKFAKEATDNGGMTSIWSGNYLFVVVVEPDIAETLMKVYLEKGDLTRFVKYVTGNGSIFAPVSIWRPRRKILAPTFKSRNLQGFVPVFAKQANVMIDRLRSTVGKGAFAFWPFITMFTMDSVCESTLGVNINVQENSGHYFLQVFEKGCSLIAKRMMEPWSYNDVMYQLNPDSKELTKCKTAAYDLIYKFIKLHKNDDARKVQEPSNNNLEEKSDCLRPFMEVLMNSSSGKGVLTETELAEETLVILMAGTDTSAVGAAFTALLLAENQDVQDKVFEELQKVFVDDRPTEAKDLPRLKYLDAVIKESLRLYPPVPVVVRHADKDFTLSSGLTIVEGCTVLIHIWGIHRNPKYWGPDADQFRPERFFEPLKHPLQFIPFSYGNRNCLGSKYAMMSMKTALSMLLRKYRILPATPINGTKGHKPFRVKYDIMMKDVENFTLQLEERL